MLTIERFDTFYSNSQVLREFSLNLAPGEIVGLLGRNGAGKTTALKSIMGILAPRHGSMHLDGEVLTHLPAHQIPKHGIGYVPQGRRLFAELTVRENLEIGLMTRKTGSAALDRALSYFPSLRERFRQRAGTLSGGEQSMLAVARALCIEPRYLLLDEPVEGLMPTMVETIRQVLLRLRDDGTGILVVEQRVDAVLPVADRILFMEHGRIAAEMAGAQVQADRSVLNRYLGVGS